MCGIVVFDYYLSAIHSRFLVYKYYLLKTKCIADEIIPSPMLLSN